MLRLKHGKFFVRRFLRLKELQSKTKQQKKKTKTNKELFLALINYREKKKNGKKCLHLCAVINKSFTIIC